MMRQSYGSGILSKDLKLFYMPSFSCAYTPTLKKDLGKCSCSLAPHEETSSSVPKLPLVDLYPCSYIPECERCFCVCVVDLWALESGSDRLTSPMGVSYGPKTCRKTTVSQKLVSSRYRCDSARVPIEPYVLVYVLRGRDKKLLG